MFDEGIVSELRERIAQLERTLEELEGGRMTYREDLLRSILNGLGMGIGLGLVTIAFVALVMVATARCP